MQYNNSSDREHLNVLNTYHIKDYDKMSLWGRFIDSLRNLWPLSNSREVTELPILYPICFTNQRIITDESNYVILVYFEKFFNNSKKVPLPRKYINRSSIGFWESCFYRPILLVIPKQVLLLEFESDNVYTITQAQANLSYTFSIRIEYHWATNTEIITNYYKSHLYRYLRRRKDIENQIRINITNYFNSIANYIYTHTTIFRLDDLQGTDITDYKFLQLLKNSQEEKKNTGKALPREDRRVKPRGTNKEMCETNEQKNKIQKTNNDFSEIIKYI